MKKALLIFLAIVMISCSSAPKSQEPAAGGSGLSSVETAPVVQEPAASETVEYIPADEEPEIAVADEEIVPETIAFDEAGDSDDTDEPEPAMPEPEAELVVTPEDIPAEAEPVPAEITIAELPKPVPPPAPAAPPLPRPVPAPQPEPSPIVIPEEEPQPPVIVHEPMYRIVPELPYPAFTGQQETIVFSRTARATVGQLVEVPFRGIGWVYIGEARARRGIAYDSRRLDPEGQSFVFRTEAPGIYALRFYRQDFVRDYILNDYVQVIVGESPETAGSGWFSPPIDRGRVIADPRWPSSIEEATRPDRAVGQAGESSPPPASPATTQAPAAGAAVQPAPAPSRTQQPAAPASPRLPHTGDEGVQQVSQPVLSATPEVPPAEITAETELPPDSSQDAYLKKAREEFEAGRIAPAISLLDRFRERYPSGSDEAWWLYAQCYEANGPGRNILAALDYYRRLVREYPQSSRAGDARRRIAYLERYYININ